MLDSLPEKGEANQANVLVAVVREVLLLGIEVVLPDLARHHVRREAGARQIDADQIDTRLFVRRGGQLGGGKHGYQPEPGGTNEMPEGKTLHRVTFDDVSEWSAVAGSWRT